MIHMQRTNSDNSDFQNLVIDLDKLLAELDGDEHEFYAQYNKAGHLTTVVVSYENGKAIGCGAFKEYNSNTVEIKRMFTMAENRGKGIAHAVLNELEKWAAELGYTTAVLETGKRQYEAIGLYQKAGYNIIPNYGQYKDMENSVCMQKSI